MIYSTFAFSLVLSLISGFYAAGDLAWFFNLTASVSLIASMAVREIKEHISALKD